ncbi:Protein ACTIVITY OF BC1 COMPLEX KINASE 3, chloroplastic [Linum grandiflorum]
MLLFLLPSLLLPNSALGLSRNLNSCLLIQVVRRTLEILLTLGSFGLKLWLDGRNGVFDQNKRIRATELRKIFTRLGPTFVKLGQGLSTRPDICPPEFLEELAELQDDLPTFPDDEAFACIETELGVSLNFIYSAISPSPIAAASLGQVYKAQLKSSGQIVAVKVQRPGIEEVIGLDFYLVRGLGGLINKYVDSSPVMLLLLLMNSPAEFIRSSITFRRFKKLYVEKEDILVPDIFWDYTSGKVLTMEWVDGVKLSQHEAIESQGLKVLDLVNTGIQCSLRQLLEYGYFHADPHPVPAYYALILRSVTVLEGLAVNADPNFKVLAASYPYFAKRLLTDPNPYLRDALIERATFQRWEV